MINTLIPSPNRVHATDPDQLGNITYHQQNGTVGAEVFNIDEFTGELLLADMKLDFERE